MLLEVSDGALADVLAGGAAALRTTGAAGGAAAAALEALVAGRAGERSAAVHMCTRAVAGRPAVAVTPTSTSVWPTLRTPHACINAAYKLCVGGR